MEDQADRTASDTVRCAAHRLELDVASVFGNPFPQVRRAGDFPSVHASALLVIVRHTAFLHVVQGADAAQGALPASGIGTVTGMRGSFCVYRNYVPILESERPFSLTALHEVICSQVIQLGAEGATHWGVSKWVSARPRPGVQSVPGVPSVPA
jgi:hypothetical protein